jgi:hypothetical protein
MILETERMLLEKGILSELWFMKKSVYETLKVFKKNAEQFA